MNSKLKWLLAAAAVLIVAVGGYLLVNWIITAKPFSSQDKGPKAEDFNNTTRVGWDGKYRPGRWTPVDLQVQIAKLKDAFGGTVTVNAQQDSLTNLSIGRDFNAYGDKAVNIPLVSKIKFAGDKYELVITDKDGNKRWSSEYALYGDAAAPATAVELDEMLIGVHRGTGSQSSVALLEKYCRTPGNHHNVYVTQKRQEQLPWDWTGYDPLDLFVLHDADLTKINSDQATAITRWVNGGGKLLVVLGGRPLPVGHPVTKLLPFTVDKTIEAQIQPDQAKAWGLKSATGQAAVQSLWSLQGAAEKGWNVLNLDGSGVAYFAAGQVGFGKVGVLGLDITKLPSQSDAGAAAFWANIVNQLDNRLTVNQSPSNDDENTGQQSSYGPYGQYGNGSYDMGPTVMPTDNVLKHLLAIPQLRPLSIWWVIGLLSALAILLGPVDYLVLKKLDRLPLTWVTSAVCIVVFSVGAYYGVQRIRGGAMQVRVVSMLDSVAGEPSSSWSTAYTGIFAPESDNFHLTGVGEHEWWSALSPAESGQTVYSYNSGRTASRTVYCVQRDGGNVPSGLPINIWSMQCLLSEAPMEAARPKNPKDSLPLFPISARLLAPATPGGPHHLRVTNQGVAAVESGMVQWTDPNSAIEQTAAIAAIEPGDSVTVELVAEGNASNIQSLLSSLGIADAQGVQQRTQAVADYLRNGGLVVCVKLKSPPIPFHVEGKSSHDDHIQVVRLVVPGPNRGVSAENAPQPTAAPVQR